jgi:hypothetical protein
MKETVGKIEFCVIAKKVFELGRTVTTPGALVGISMEDITTCLMRHSQGDWGDISQADWEDNEVAVRKGYRLFSVYRCKNGKTFWIITEADRSATTILLPDEY